MSASPENHDDTIQSLIAQILDAESRGEAVDRDSFLIDHQEYAEELIEFFATHDRMKSLSKPLRSTAEHGDEEATIPPIPPSREESTLPPTQDVPDDATLPPSRDTPTVDTTANGDRHSSIPESGDTVRYFGDYELIEEIARGGMGVVFKARQLNLNRIVALKMILAGQFAGEEDVLRFQSEAEAAAQLDHPGIVPIFEIGEHSGQHYFSMGYVDGQSLSDQVADGPLPPQHAAELMVRICDAMAFAHDRGVIHRDLKPANILLDAIGQPKVTDFGLAKRTERESELTGSGQILGTPAYMPPEQAAGKVDEVGAVADVYSLGAILYCLLTGRPPFQAANPLDTLMQVLEQEPVSPRQLNVDVSKDLETICLKCLEKNPQKRYASASELKEELQRFLDGEPIKARPVGRAERVWRWGKRHPWKASTAAALVLLAMTLVVGGPTVAVREIQMRGRVEQELYANRVQLAEREWNLAQILPAKKALAECPPGRRGWEWNHVSRLCALEALSLEGHVYGVSSLALRSDGLQLASSGFDGTIQLWDMATGSNIKTLETESKTAVICVAYSPDGTRIASGSDDGRARIWDLESDRPVHTLEGHSRHITSLDFSPDGRTLATAGEEGVVNLWNTTDGTLTQTIKPNAGFVRTVRFHPEGKLLATAGQTAAIQIWDAKSGQKLRSFNGHSRYVTVIDFSPNGRQLLSASADSSVRVWDTESGEMLKRLSGHKSIVSAAQFSPTGREIASASHDRTLVIWDLESGQQVRTFKGHERAVNATLFSPDGRWLISGSADQTIKLWDPKGGNDVQVIDADIRAVNAAMVLPGQSQLITAAGDFSAKLWHPETGAYLSEPFGHQGQIRHIAFHQESNRLATAGDDKLLRIWDWNTKTVLRVFKEDTSRITSMEFSRDGEQLLTSSREWNAKLWDITGEEHLKLDHEADVYGAMFSDDQTKCFTIDEAGLITAWDRRSGKKLQSNSINLPTKLFARSRIGNRFWVADPYGNLNEIDCDRLKVSTYLWETQSSPITAIAVHPGGSRLATGNEEGVLTLFDIYTKQVVLSLTEHSKAITHLSFSRDGRWLVSSGADGTVRLRDSNLPDATSKKARWIASFAWERTIDKDRARQTIDELDISHDIHALVTSHLDAAEPMPDSWVMEASEMVSWPDATPAVYRRAVRKAEAANTPSLKNPWVHEAIALGFYRLGKADEANAALQTFKQELDQLDLKMTSPVESMLLHQRGKEGEAMIALAKTWGVLVSTLWNQMLPDAKQRHERLVHEASRIVFGAEYDRVSADLIKRVGESDVLNEQVNLDDLSQVTTPQKETRRTLLPLVIARQAVEQLGVELQLAEPIIARLRSSELPPEVLALAIPMAEDYTADGQLLINSVFALLTNHDSKPSDYALADKKLDKLETYLNQVTNDSYDVISVKIARAMADVRLGRLQQAQESLIDPAVQEHKLASFANIFLAMCHHQLEQTDELNAKLELIRSYRTNGKPIPSDSQLGRLIAELEQLVAK